MTTDERDRAMDHLAYLAEQIGVIECDAWCAADEGDSISAARARHTVARLEAERRDVLQKFPEIRFAGEAMNPVKEPTS